MQLNGDERGESEAGPGLSKALRGLGQVASIPDCSWGMRKGANIHVCGRVMSRWEPGRAAGCEQDISLSFGPLKFEIPEERSPGTGSCVWELLARKTEF